MSTVSWFNIPSDNIDRSTKFYEQAFNWKVLPLSKEKDSKFDFHTVLTGKSDSNNWPQEPGVINGCIVKREMGIPHATILILVDDLLEAEKKIILAGGVVVSERMIIEAINGELFLAKDTEGNIIEVFKFRTTN